ncbi:MAG: ABC transporter substrate-binding protein [Alphaproteobacteria bacterium]
MKKIVCIMGLFISLFTIPLLAFAGTKTIIDDLGLTVEIPIEPKRIIIADLPPLVHTYYVANGGIEGLIGGPQNNALVDTMLPKVYPEVKDLNTGFRKDGEVNIEELLALEPDLILYRSDNAQSGEMIRNTGVPAVAFQTFNMNGGNTVAPVVAWLETLGQILNKEEQTERLKRQAYESLGIVQSRMWNIPEEEKVRILYFNGLSADENILKVSGKGLFGYFWAEIAEANDVAAKDINGAKQISIEQLYEYNPQVIFMTFSKSTPQDVMNNPLFADIDAVKNKRVYQAPLGMFSWYGPSTDVPVSFLWHAKMMYPEYFKDINIVQVTKEHYKKNYNYDITEADIEFMFGNSLEVQ